MMNKKSTTRNSVGNGLIKLSALAFIIALTLQSSPTALGQVPGTQPFGEGITAKKFFASAVDKDNTVWFLTETGIISFDGTKWSVNNKNPKVASAGLKNITYNTSAKGPELWLATTKGATVTSIPFDATSATNTYSLENSKILSENILAIAIGQKDIRWFGTSKGISAVKNDKWLTNSYDDRYPESIFEAFPITSMATSLDGDSLYIATKGAGVMRVFKNEVDAVSGASEYAGWGPILMPSDSVYCVHIASDGTQWFGTDKGAAKHIGFKTLEGWTVYTPEEGLADILVQAISTDGKGNTFFGTKNGLSLFDGTKWTTFKTNNGLASNNVLTISVDKKGVAWIGTDNGVSCFKDGKLTSYR
jgi:ligand-binding sensor domain-containing protein